MAKIVLEGSGKFYQHYPRVAVIVTVSAGGKKNAMAAAWHSAISHTPPIFGVSLAPKRYTYKLLTESREFAVNFLSMERARLIAAVGKISGVEGDKFARFGIETEEPLKTSAPILKDTYAAYECRLIDSRTYGDHVWVVGEIAATHIEEGMFDSEEVLDLERVRPAMYLGADRYTAPSKDDIRTIERGT
ncbi:MAG: flavin reductase family protein [Chloroflexota bacterium]|nr:flavin reductase family protein [Chloroflexota bacterium]